jgi:Family of unknown function (DUF6350)
VRSVGGRRAGRVTGPVSLALAGSRAALAAAGLGLAVVTILVVVGWIAAPPGRSGGAGAPHAGFGLLGVLRTAAVIWLAGHHVAVQVSGAGRIGMLPLGLVLLPGALLWRAGRSVVRGYGSAPGSGPGQAFKAALAVAVPYSLLAVLLAVASRTALASASIVQAVLAAFMIALVAAGFGAARELAPWAQLGAHLTARTRSVLVGTAGALTVLGAAGALATAMALAGHVSQITAVYSLLDPGLVGAGLLLIAQLAYLPNAICWAISYMLGPGFAVGLGTVVAPTGSVLGTLPAFPLLAALPSGTHGSGSAWLAGVILAMPYLAGAVAGSLVARTAHTVALEAAPLRGFCAGALTGAVLGVLAAFAGGPLGDGRLAVVGPSPWQVALLATLEVGTAAAITAGAANWRHARSRWADADLAVTQPSMDHDPSDDHVIYLDAWAADQDEGKPVRRGPATLP